MMLRIVFFVLWFGGVLSLPAAVVHFTNIAVALRQARQEGRAGHVRPGNRGLPFRVLFTDALPETAEDRRKLRRALLLSCAFGLAFAVGIAALAPNGL